MTISVFVENAWKEFAYGFMELRARGSVICPNFSRLDSPFSINGVLFWKVNTERCGISALENRYAVAS
jgi:hypothetical protein